jgi:hypothetical protein
MSNLEDITFYLVGLQDGIVYDKRAFRRDYIPLAHHAGVYLYNDLFAVLSIQTQTIHLFQIQGSRFLDVRTIGTQCYEDDDLAFAQQQELERQYEQQIQQQQQQLKQKQQQQNTSSHPDVQMHDEERSCEKEMSCSAYLDYTHEANKLGIPPPKPQCTPKPETTTEDSHTPTPTSTPIVGLKQRLLAHLFRQAMESPQPTYLTLSLSPSLPLSLSRSLPPPSLPPSSLLPLSLSPNYTTHNAPTTPYTYDATHNQHTTNTQHP